MKHKFLFFTLTIIVLALLLSSCTGGGTVASSWPGLTVNTDTVYVAYNTQIHAIDLASGNLRWRYPAKPDAKITFYANPVIGSDGQLIVGSFNNHIYSINSNTGQVNWEFSGAENRFIAGPVISSKGILAADAGKKVYHLDTAGKLSWSFSTNGATWGQPVVDESCGCVYVPSMDHYIYALDLSDGALLWKTEDLGGAIVGTPFLSDQKVLYVGTFGKEVLAIDSNNGSVVWRVATNGWVWSGLNLADNKLYVGDLEGYLYSLNAIDGSLLWQLTPEQLNGPIAGAPLIRDDMIYITTESGSLFAINTSGTVQWTKLIGGKLYSSPIFAGDNILVAITNAESLLVAINKEGIEQWSFVPEK